jgi:hypothetical protein
MYHFGGEQCFNRDLIETRLRNTSTVCSPSPGGACRLSRCEESPVTAELNTGVTTWRSAPSIGCSSFSTNRQCCTWVVEYFV